MRVTSEINNEPEIFLKVLFNNLGIQSGRKKSCEKSLLHVHALPIINQKIDDSNDHALTR